MSEQVVEIENPYEKAAEFQVRIIESVSRGGMGGGALRNPFNGSESTSSTGDTTSVMLMKSKLKANVDAYKSINQLIANAKYTHSIF